MHSLKEIGKFRVIAVSDLAMHAYGGNRERMEKDIRDLARQSLVRDKTVEISQRKTLRVATLTKAGHRLLTKTNQLPDDQPIYHGLVKPREVKHDADLYRLYQKEAARIERSGGRPVRVLLDFELKRNLNRDLALLGPEKDDLDRKSQVAEKHHLQVVNGKIPVPDLRVEYETPELELRRADLELATRKPKPAFSTLWRRIPATLWRVNSSPSLLPIGASARPRSGANFTPGNTREPNAFRRAERSTTSSPAASIARSNARTSAIAGNTKSNTSSDASECLISFS
jgi:hypothetical protein